MGGAVTTRSKQRSSQLPTVEEGRALKTEDSPVSERQSTVQRLTEEKQQSSEREDTPANRQRQSPTAEKRQSGDDSPTVEQHPPREIQSSTAGEQRQSPTAEQQPQQDVQPSTAEKLRSTEDLKYKLIKKNSFGNDMTKYTFRSSKINDDIDLLFLNLANKIIELLTTKVDAHGQCKLIVDIPCLFRKSVPIYGDDGIDTSEPQIYLDKLRHIVLKTMEINKASDMNDLIATIRQQLEDRIEDFTRGESGFFLLDITQITLKTFPFVSYHAGAITGATEAKLISAELKAKLGRQWKSKILLCESDDNFCILNAIAIQLTEILHNDAKNVHAEIVKIIKYQGKNLHKLKRYAPCLSEMKQKCKAGKLQFPLQISKTWFQRLIRCIEPPPYVCVNFFYFDKELSTVVPLYVSPAHDSLIHSCERILGKDWETKTGESNNRWKEALRSFKNNQIDIILWEMPNGKYHAGLTLNFESVIREKKTKIVWLYCKSCHSRHRWPKQLLDHLNICQRKNPANTIVRFPKPEIRPDGSTQMPYVTTNLTRGLEQNLYAVAYDLETSNKTAVPVKGQTDDITYMTAEMAFFHIYLTQMDLKDDLPAVRKIKQAPIASKIEEGSDCVPKMLLQLKAKLQQASSRIAYIRSIYANHDLSEEDQTRFDNTLCCEICGISFETDGIKKIRDHSHVISRKLR